MTVTPNYEIAHRALATLTAVVEADGDEERMAVPMEELIAGDADELTHAETAAFVGTLLGIGRALTFVAAEALGVTPADLLAEIGKGIMLAELEEEGR